MEFDPQNHVVKLCLQGQAMEANNKAEEASKIFLRAWNESSDDFERFIAAYFVARHQTEVRKKLAWFQTDLELALKINNNAVKSALSSLYLSIAECYEDINEPDEARKNRELSVFFSGKVFDNGPFYHGTRADLKVGDLLTPGSTSNYDARITMNHIYFTAHVNGAGLAAALAKGEGRERVYMVEPTGSFENDPNVTDKKFPGNLTRSYRSDAPLKVIGEITDWVKQTPEQIQQWREKLANNKGQIIN